MLLLEPVIPNPEDSSNPSPNPSRSSNPNSTASLNPRPANITRTVISILTEGQRELLLEMLNYCR